MKDNRLETDLVLESHERNLLEYSEFKNLFILIRKRLKLRKSNISDKYKDLDQHVPP